MKNARVLSALTVGALLGTLNVGIADAGPAKVAGKVIAVTGPVTVSREDMPRHPLKFKDSLYWRDLVEAHKDGMARALLLGKTTVTVRELSRLELREERQADGARYIAELISGKVRASVARMLMRQGEQVEVWTWNTVASVRGTDFIVETVEQPARGGFFGFLWGREASRETVVVTLSGEVAVSSRLGGTGRVERIGAFEAARVSGNRDPVRFRLNADDMRMYLKGLNPPRPDVARNGDRVEVVGRKVESAALAASAQSIKGAPYGGDRGRKGGTRSGVRGDGKGKGNGHALARANATGNGGGLGLGDNGIGFGLDQSNLAKDVKKATGGGKGKGH